MFSVVSLVGNLTDFFAIVVVGSFKQTNLDPMDLSS